MKKRISKLVAVCVMLLIYSISYGQTSEKGFSFQGFSIDPDGKALSNTNVTVKFTVYPKTGTGETYTEEINTSTDNYGVFSAIVGADKPADFKKLNFTAKDVNYWLKVEVKKTSGGSYTVINDAEMQAVPYARVADNGVPVGTIVAYAGPKNKVPAGWLICDGTSYDGNDPKYTQLYKVLNTTWGSTGGGANFNVPDLRGMFLRGVDDGRGKDPNATSRKAGNTGGNTGDHVGSVQNDELESHNHPITDPGHKHPITDPGHKHDIKTASNDDNGNTNDYGDNHARTNSTESSQTGITINSQKTGITVNNRGGSETRPVNAGVYYIIKQ